MRLLLVEDNLELAGWLAKILRQDNYVVDVFHDGEEADHALAVAVYDLVILDLTLPKINGMQLLRRIRSRKDTVPVIILTANASLDGRVAGLDEGADDYLAKPFDIAELEARIRVQLRRSARRPDPVISCGGLAFDTNTRLFTLSGAALALTPREHAVLEMLLMKSGQTVSKAQLSQSIFGLDDLADPSAIEIYVHRVRKKLEGSDVRIVTLRGLGYLLQHDAH
ncbi:UNVERIFIED_ORG: two-component system response regulator TctD [Xanthobacter viscosus]|jgi:two-component system response regulator TctD|uniref:Response regulator n=1 Tax=Xanthobacter autotrophicus TaxID=280 RepID=A0A6C1KF99_XANAU|nr:response regulator [Xanthobacter autotrophicus]TLX42862.1 response regulator [Xanthobacter autotrophicus]